MSRPRSFIVAAVSFTSQDKTWWNFDAPALERYFTKQALNTIVDLDCTEVQSQELQALRKPKVRG